MMIPVRHFAGLRCLLYRLFIARVVIDMELPLMVKRNFTLPTWCDIDLVRVEIDLHKPAPGLIIHSDRSSQYTCYVRRTLAALFCWW